ncbi:uncharacterized protein KY384_000937 [Bacidia gigantensis]|uniref:uncharacterized protein n=1 Tax=Bacidia gigantensis TaxID=2732470 RepID=UPI001D0397B6|nr:uncharacterized protein KY384_000937 [Bacidia gigantensis]KAG8534094.1 hypothetical protein KY384_000937 [Bacidia gigantensis]
MSNIEASDDAQRIEVNGQVIDPSEHYARDAQNTDHIIVTVKDVLDDDQKAALQKEKVDLLEDLGYNNMLCRYRPTNLEPLRNLDFVKQVDVYRNLFKIPDELTVLIEELQGKADFESEAFPIDVMVHEDVKNLDPLADDISKISEVDRNQMDVMPDRIRLRVPLSKLKAIAADDRVRILEEALTPVLYDDEAKHIVGAPLRIQGDTEFRGAGQIVAVVDGGFDLGSVEDCHPALTNRIRGLISVGRAKDTGTTEAQKVDDWVGHGTHVCGTIVGKEIETSRGMVGGVAQDADLVVSSLQNAKGKVIDVMPSMQVLFEVPYKLHHACIHSNSWGDNLSGGMMQRAYTTDASTIDDFVRTNPDVLICFSAGNYNENVKDRPPKGEEKPAIGSQASAKNCLTVGASGSTRAVVDTKTSHVDKVDPNLMSPISSRGPVKGFRGDPPTVKRMKPDVVAPGHNVVSAHTRHPKAPIDGLPEATSSSFPDVLWKVRTGTSHSTPLVSGCAAILRQVLQSKGCQNPPAALLKAIIINGADKLPDIDVEAQGFGRVNLQSSVNMLQTPPILAENILKSAISSSGGSVIGNSLRQNDSFAFELSPVKAADELELKITMVYNDKGGGQIQNNLNLAVVDKVTGEIRHGGLSEDDIDVQNNVEQVVCQPAPTTPVIVRVTAQKIFKDLDQDFVLAWSTTAPFQIEGQVMKAILLHNILMIKVSPRARILLGRQATREYVGQSTLLPIYKR